MVNNSNGRKYPSKDDLIWVQEAVRLFGRSLSWFQDRVKDGLIKAYKIPGDRKQYLSRAELEEVLAPRPWTEEDGEGE